MNDGPIQRQVGSALKKARCWKSCGVKDKEGRRGR